MTNDSQSGVYLASASPARSALLQRLNLPFERISHGIEEPARTLQQTAEAYVTDLALLKAAAVWAQDRQRDWPCLAADTVILCDDVVLGKPVDRAHAADMLRQLSGRSHTVWTGVCARSATKTVSVAVQTVVHFWPLQAIEIQRYCETDEPLGKAGGYALQGLGELLIQSIEGSPSNVIGLPLAETVRLLQQLDVQVGLS